MRAIAMLALVAACEPTVLSSFGARCAVRRGKDGVCRPRSFPHDGADFGPGEIGDPVLASADGVVTNVVEAPGYGIEVVIAHDPTPPELGPTRFRYHTGYLHLRAARVEVGDVVKRGEPIGEVGLFWASDGLVHVHWRVWQGRRLVDPERLAVGCFERDHLYFDLPGMIELTYPLEC